MKRLEADIVRKLKTSRRYLTRGDLGEACSTGRGDVAEAVEALRARGYRIDEVPGEGYRLVEAPDMMAASEIKLALRTSVLGREVHVHERVVSTNDSALRLARDGAPEGTLVLAEEQTGGRGRLGRHWHSPAGLGLWFSLVLRPRLAARESSSVSLAAALGIARALRKDYGVKTEVKWPNDVVVGPKKICGLLTEAEFVEDRVKFIVLGVGLNVLQREGDFPPQLRAGATSLVLAGGGAAGRLGVLLSVLAAVEEAYLLLGTGGFAAIREDVIAVSSLVGKFTTVVTGRDEVEGTVVDMDENGALILRTECGQLRYLIAGEVVRVG
jgi:BirA family biotin operon repressor/biotin-[acetyl-CoA-carboxylase] ligase